MIARGRAGAMSAWMRSRHRSRMPLVNVTREHVFAAELLAHVLFTKYGSDARAPGGWVIAPQARQENFSRTCWITFHCRGMSSSVSVTSSPILRNRLSPQHGQVEGSGFVERLPIPRSDAVVWVVGGAGEDIAQIEL
jgi:hypothetical protein